ncbi:MAG TPA: hypothetical protein VIG64_00930 [Actinomycetota bacterium]
MFRERLSKAASARLEAAVREANPHLDLSALSPGMIVEVPDLAEAKPSREVDLGDDAGRAERAIKEIIMRSVQDLNEAAGRLEKDASSERERLSRFFDFEEVVTAAESDELIRAELDEFRNALAREEDAAKEQLARLQKVMAVWAEEVEAIDTLLP